MHKLPLALIVALSLSGCQPATPDAADALPTEAPADYQVQDWVLPADGHAAQPDMVVAPDGTVLLSWVEAAGSGSGGHTLKFARFTQARWSDPQAIAHGDDWVVSWANTPHIAATADGALWAHWLQKAGSAKYAADIALVRSGDGGKSWSAPLLVNDDGTATEHGFVSLWPASADTLGVAWLDGRLTARTGPADADHENPHKAHAKAGPGAPMMTLRTTTFDSSLGRHDERTLDLSTCDCCQTGAALTATGVAVAYRDRDPAEVRDIHVARFDDGAWQPPSRVHADDWTMPACPVNGPDIAATGSEAVVGWYTAPGGTPMVKLARSRDGGATFDAPVVLDSGEAVQGRVSVALDADAAWVLWLRETDASQSLQLARFTADLSQELERIEVARLQGRGRGTGVPQLALADGAAYVIWTDVMDGVPGLHGARVARP